MDTKLCTICNQTKTIDKFYKSQRGKKCISCVLEKARKYKKIDVLILILEKLRVENKKKDELDYGKTL